MCEPSLMLMAAGTGLNAIGSAKEAKAQKAAGKQNAKIHRLNAGIKRKLAQDALKRGDRTEAEHRMDVANLKADQQARMLAGGQTLTGTNSALLDDTAFYGELDAHTIRYNAGQEAWGHNVEANNYDMQAQLSEMGGNNAAAATILTGAAQVANSWSNY